MADSLDILGRIPTGLFLCIPRSVLDFLSEKLLFPNGRISDYGNLFLEHFRVSGAPVHMKMYPRPGM